MSMTRTSIDPVSCGGPHGCMTCYGHCTPASDKPEVPQERPGRAEALRLLRQGTRRRSGHDRTG